MKEITEFKNILKKFTTNYLSEIDDITSHMQPYDVSAFDYELNSEFSYYSLKCFDELTFKKMALETFSVNLDDASTNEKLEEYIKEYSRAVITLKALRGYIKANNIMTEIDNENMVYSS